MKLTQILPFAVLLLGCTMAQVPIGVTDLDPAKYAITSTDKPVRVSGGIVAGSILTNVSPVIPEEARCQHIGGSVVTHVVIGRDGKVVSAVPISGPDLLRKPYVDAIKQWTYRPFEIDGQPVEVETTVTINIQMNASGCPPNAAS
jgi:outer membrane biosynthesis protein TonB